MALDQGVVELLEDLRGSLHRWVAERSTAAYDASPPAVRPRPTHTQSIIAAALDRVRPQTVDHFCDGLIQLAHAASTLDEPDPDAEPTPDRGQATPARRHTRDNRTDQQLRSTA